MKKLQKPDEIWRVKIQKSDLVEAVKYATISLPWTFDRMRYGVSTQRSMNRRLMNIMKGVLNQTLLERIMKNKGFKCAKNWKHYRESDIFDFSINGRVYDVKTGHIYDEYSKQWERDKFTPELLIKNKDYPGPIWKRFFPMTITISQITYKKGKDGYIFGIAKTFKDVNKVKPLLGDKGIWCASPFGQAAVFFHSRPLIMLREEKKSGFKVNIKWESFQQKLLTIKEKVEVTLIGEWNKNRQIEDLIIKPSQTITSKKEFSSLSCIKCEHPAFLSSDDKLIISVKDNLKEIVPKLTDPTENLNNSQFELELGNYSFTNLKMPEDYEVFWIGHTTPEIFFKEFKKYKSYFIPLPGREINQEGILTQHSKEKLEAMDNRKKKYIEEGFKVMGPDFKPLIKGKKFNGGLLIAQMGRMASLGAASYIYPPQPGAFPESAIYILPSDLYIMDDIK